jgi:integrase
VEAIQDPPFLLTRRKEAPEDAREHLPIRSGEQIALRWGDVVSRPGQQALLYVDRAVVLDTVESGFKAPKSGKGRQAELSRDAVEALGQLRAWQEERGIPCGPDDLIFGGEISSTKQLYKRVARACRRAGIEHTSRHGLRHTGITWQAHDGVSSAERQANAGHATSSMQDRYTHAMPATGNVARVYDRRRVLGASQDSSPASQESPVPGQQGAEEAFLPSDPGVDKS